MGWTGQVWEATPLGREGAGRQRGCQVPVLVAAVSTAVLALISSTADKLLEEGMATPSSILAWRLPMDRGAWWATVHGVTQSQTQQSD